MHNQKITQLIHEIEKYKSISVTNGNATAELNNLRDENNFLKRESQNSQLMIQELQQEKESLKYRIRELEEQASLARSKVNVNHSEIKSYRTTNDTGES